MHNRSAIMIEGIHFYSMTFSALMNEKIRQFSLLFLYSTGSEGLNGGFSWRSRFEVFRVYY